MTETTVLNGCTVATMNPERAEYRSGHLVVTGGRIAAVGAGPAAPGLPDASYVDASGCLATPGLVNTHHHLYQWVTRGLAVDSTLFGWLTELYPIWGGLDAAIVRAAATAGLAWLAGTGCSTTTDHHYVFPRGGGDVLAAEIDAAREVGLRFHPTRGSMDLGRSSGGLPPDNLVEDVDEILSATEAAIDAYHDPAPGSMLQIGVAPCSPFSVTENLLTGAAGRACRRQRNRGSALPVVECQARCRHRQGPRPAGGRRAGGAGRGWRRLQRGLLAAGRGQACAAVRQGPGRPDRTDRP